MKMTLKTCKTESEAWKLLREQTTKFIPKENKDGVEVPTDENGRQLREAGIALDGGKFTPFLVVSLK